MGQPAGPALLLACALLAGPAPAQEGRPLSAIDWLSDSVGEAALRAPVTPPVAVGPPRPPVIDEPPTAPGASAPGITVTPLDPPPGVSAGVLPPEETGLPADLWAGSDAAILTALVRDEPVAILPSLQDLLVTLMLAKAAPPAGSEQEGFLLARVDRLLGLGDLGAARATLEAGDLLDPEAFRRWFDVTLLTGTEAAACERLRAAPSLAPTLDARVFCLARDGDWTAAALTLGTARALGDVSADDDALLSLFLDPEFGSPEDLASPERPSPLSFRLHEAVGDLIPTEGLPLAFAHADLRSTVAWRAQIEAAERLARAGALPPDALRDVYLLREPAASGGVWDRAGAVQALDLAVAEGDAGAVGTALPRAWSLLSEAGLAVPLARLYGPDLAGLDLSEDAGAVAFRAVLLSADYGEATRVYAPATAPEVLWAAIAEGRTDGVAAYDGASAAVLDGLGGAAPSGALAEALGSDRPGEAALRAIAAFDQGLDGDRGAVANALATLRALGLDDVARRAALEYLIQESRP